MELCDLQLEIFCRIFMSVKREKNGERVDISVYLAFSTVLSSVQFSSVLFITVF